MKRLPFAVLIGVLILAASCGLIFLTAPSPQPWASAMNIECWDLLVQGPLGGDDTPTTISEVGGWIIIYGHFTATEGWITAGEDDTTAGYFRAYGNNDSIGGYGRFYMGASHDSIIDHYKIGIASGTDDFQIGPNSDLDAFKMGNDGTVDLTAGVKLAGTSMTASAAELNFNDGAIAGTAVASKTVVLGSGKEIDELTITVADIPGSLDVGGTFTVAPFTTFSYKGTEVTSTAAELNLLDGETFLNLVSTPYDKDNVGANESDSFYYDLTNSIKGLNLPWAGSVVGISLSSSANVTTGSLVVWPANAGGHIDEDCYIKLEAGDGFTTKTTFAKDAYAVSNVQVWADYTTSADWAPTTSEVRVTLWLEF